MASCRTPVETPGLANSSTKLQLRDLVCLFTLLLIAIAILFPRPERYPLQLWDESRLANNALEMVRSGNWSVPMYDGQPDHWNTKPPLMIWAIAGFLRLGLPPLIALRLPSLIAALATLVLVWATCRFLLRDFEAATAAGLLLLGSLLFMGTHVAFTGDYDALETLFVSLYVVALWAACESDAAARGRWIYIAAASAVLAILTKGVAAAMPLPGVCLFLLLDERARKILSEKRLWLAAIGALVLGCSYYITREAYDHGYVTAVRMNELGGRFLANNGGQRGGWFFYLGVLIRGFEPGLILIPLAALPLLGRRNRRRSLVLVCLLSATALLIVISTAKTKFFWYAAPTIPLLSLAAAVGLADGLSWLRERMQRQESSLQPARMQSAIAIVLLLFCGIAFYRNQVHYPRSRKG